MTDSIQNTPADQPRKTLSIARKRTEATKPHDGRKSAVKPRTDANRKPTGKKTGKPHFKKRPPMTEEERKQRESARRHFDARDKRLTGDKARLALKWLMTTFPTVFNKQDPKPLKIKCTMDIIGVHKAAGGGIGTGFGINKLKLAIEGWVNTSRYQYALAQPGAKRYDPLTGLPVDAVTSEHMKNAKTRRAGLLRHLKRTKKLTNRPGPHKKSKKPAIQQKVKRDERREKAAQNPKEPTPRGKKKKVHYRGKKKS